MKFSPSVKLYVFVCVCVCVISHDHIVCMRERKKKRLERFGSCPWMPCTHSQMCSQANHTSHMHAEFHLLSVAIFSLDIVQLSIFFFLFCLFQLFLMFFQKLYLKFSHLLSKHPRIAHQSFPNRRQGGWVALAGRHCGEPACHTLRSMLSRQLHKDGQVIFMEEGGV